MSNISRATFLQYTQHDAELLRLEIKVLECAAENLHNNNFCANHHWYRTFKPILLNLAGWSARDAHLRSSEAYDAVYSYLYDLLPECKHESMCY